MGQRMPDKDSIIPLSQDRLVVVQSPRGIAGLRAAANSRLHREPWLLGQWSERLFLGSGHLGGLVKPVALHRKWLRCSTLCDSAFPASNPFIELAHLPLIGGTSRPTPRGTLRILLKYQGADRSTPHPP